MLSVSAINHAQVEPTAVSAGTSKRVLHFVLQSPGWWLHEILGGERNTALLEMVFEPPGIDPFKSVACILGSDGGKRLNWLRVAGRFAIL